MFSRTFQGRSEQDAGFFWNGDPHFCPVFEKFLSVEQGVDIDADVSAADVIAEEVAVGQAHRHLAFQEIAVSIFRSRVLAVPAADLSDLRPEGDGLVGGKSFVGSGAKDIFPEICRRKDVVMADEGCGKPGLGIRIEVDGPSGLLNPAVVHEVDPVAHDHGFLLVVGDEDGRDAQFLLDPSDLDLQGVAEQGVDCGKRFIQKQDLGSGDKCPGQSRALLLSAGQLGRILERIVRQADNVDHLVDGLLDLVHGDVLLLQTEGHVLLYVHVGEEAVVLKDHSDVAVLWSHVSDVFAVQVDLAAGRIFQAGQDSQQGTLAAAGGAEEGDQLPFLDLKVDIFQDLLGSEILADMLKSDIF